jgi:hypothetical protein
MLIECVQNSFDWSKLAPVVTATISIIISIVALWRSSRSSRKTTSLSVQQAMFKMVQEKSKDCNIAWINEPENEQNEISPHFAVITEVIISLEVINRAFQLFDGNYKSLEDQKGDYYYLYWKQLRPAIRGWIMNQVKKASEFDDRVYKDQLNTINTSFGKYFEK